MVTLEKVYNTIPLLHCALVCYNVTRVCCVHLFHYINSDFFLQFLKSFVVSQVVVCHPHGSKGQLASEVAVFLMQDSSCCINFLLLSLCSWCSMLFVGMNGELTKANVLTIAKVQEAELQNSSSRAPTHSPPFNTSSESGDSGVYSLVGK